MKKKPILIVDDEKNIRLTMSQSLEPLEIPVKTAVNGEEAIRKLREAPVRIGVFRFEDAWDRRYGGPSADQGRLA